MIKLAFITNIIPHYRETFYKKLLTNYDYLLLSSKQYKEDGRPALNYSIMDNHKLIDESHFNLLGIDFVYQKHVLATIKKFKPDIIVILGLSRYLSNWQLLFWSKIKNKKVIIWSSGWERMQERNLIYKIKRLMNVFYYNLSDYILVYSSKGKEYLKPLLLNKNKIEVCYNGIEIEQLLKNKKDTLMIAQNLKKDYENKKIFLYVGGMLKEKKVDLLIKAFKELCNKYEDIILWLVGDGPDIEYFKNISRDDQKVIYWGRKVENVDVYFAACDYFVLPGLGGLAINQAMFWGKPCIVSEADGTEDDLVIDKITGFRFETNDRISLLNAMEKALNLDVNEYYIIGKECERIILSPSNVNNMVNIFKETVSKSL